VFDECFAAGAAAGAADLVQATVARQGL
jgi:hypothetical protein